MEEDEDYENLPCWFVGGRLIDQFSPPVAVLVNYTPHELTTNRDYPDTLYFYKGTYTHL